MLRMAKRKTNTNICAVCDHKSATATEHRIHASTHIGARAAGVPVRLWTVSCRRCLAPIDPNKTHTCSACGATLPGHEPDPAILATLDAATLAALNP